MQSIYFFAVVNCCFIRARWMANILTNRKLFPKHTHTRAVLLLFYYYFIWIDLNGMICIFTNLHCIDGQNGTRYTIQNVLSFFFLLFARRDYDCWRCNPLLTMYTKQQNETNRLNCTAIASNCLPKRMKNVWENNWNRNNNNYPSSRIVSFFLLFVCCSIRSQC